MSDYITTYSKVHFTPLAPKKEEIRILDIAHPLSLMTRANGHFPQFYSVAQHSIQCAKEAAARGYGKRVELACLLHDASEAYLADITRPVKKNLTQYQTAEKVLQNAIYEHFLGSVPTGGEAALVREIDDVCLYYEFYHFAQEKLFEEPGRMYSQADFSLRAFDEVEREFLQMFDLLSECAGAGKNGD